MKYNLAQVADLFGVSQGTITRWVQQDALPVHEINSQFRFDRCELLEWAVYRKQAISGNLFAEINGDQITQLSLADAIQFVGPAPSSADHSKRAVFSSLIRMLPLPAGFNSAELLELVLCRERAGGTAVGEGIAVPHSRYPIVFPGLSALVMIVYLQQPLEYSTPDGKPVDTLFFMISPTVHVHLRLLSRIGTMLGLPRIRTLLAQRAGQGELVSAIRNEEVLNEHPALS